MWWRREEFPRARHHTGRRIATVVQVFHVLDRGGAETVALDLCKAIPAGEVRQVMLTVGRDEGRLVPQFMAAGAGVRHCAQRPILSFVPRLWRCFRSIRPDVVMSHIGVRSGLILAVAAAAKVPVRIAELNSEGDRRPKTLPWRLLRTMLRTLIRRFATDVIGVTQSALDFAGPARGDRRYRVRPNGVDIDRFAACRKNRAEGQPSRMLHIGRAAPEKNRAFLLEVHGEARKLRWDTTLTLVGPGGTADLPQRDPVALAEFSVRVPGETDYPERALADSDVLLLPSMREGLPGVVLEALAAGVPVLASDLPGLRELASEVDGLALLPLNAGAKAWADTALRLADTPPAERERIVDTLRRSRFTLENSSAHWRTLWTRHR